LVNTGNFINFNLFFMKNLSFNQMETVEGGKFWGRDSGCHPCDATGHRVCWSTYYILGFSTGYSYSYPQC